MNCLHFCRLLIFSEARKSIKARKLELTLNKLGITPDPVLMYDLIFFFLFFSGMQQYQLQIKNEQKIHEDEDKWIRKSVEETRRAADICFNHRALGGAKNAFLNRLMELEAQSAWWQESLENGNYEIPPSPKPLRLTSTRLVSPSYQHFAGKRFTGFTQPVPPAESSNKITANADSIFRPPQASVRRPCIVIGNDDEAENEILNFTQHPSLNNFQSQMNKNSHSQKPLHQNFNPNSFQIVNQQLPTQQQALAHHPRLIPVPNYTSNTSVQTPPPNSVHFQNNILSSNNSATSQQIPLPSRQNSQHQLSSARNIIPERLDNRQSNSAINPVSSMHHTPANAPASLSTIESTSEANARRFLLQNRIKPGGSSASDISDAAMMRLMSFDDWQDSNTQIRHASNNGADFISDIEVQSIRDGTSVSYSRNPYAV